MDSIVDTVKDSYIQSMEILMDNISSKLERIDQQELSQRNPQAFSEFISLLPKAEIHLHVEALVTPKSLHALNQRHQLYPECKTSDELKNKLDLKEIHDLNEMIDQFIKVQSFFREEEDFALIDQHIPEYMKNNQITYMEMHFAPSSFLRNGLNFNGMVSNFENEVNNICRETGRDVRIIIDLSRTFGVDNAMNNLNFVKSYLDSHNDSRIIAVGLGGSEKTGTPKEYGPVFKQAQQWRIKTVAHGGEDSGPEQMWSTLKELNPLRIGHGTCSFQDEKLMDTLRDRAIPLEICPTSNVITGKFMKKMSEHPIRTYYDRGMVVTLNTDDPVIFGIELNHEYNNLYIHLNFTLQEIVQIIRNGYTSSFMSEQDKVKSLELLDKTLEKAIKQVYKI